MKSYRAVLHGRRPALGAGFAEPGSVAGQRDARPPPSSRLGPHADPSRAAARRGPRLTQGSASRGRAPPQLCGSHAGCSPASVRHTHPPCRCQPPVGPPARPGGGHTPPMASRTAPATQFFRRRRRRSMRPAREPPSRRFCRRAREKTPPPACAQARRRKRRSLTP
jgi:hypothetical protein